MVKTIDGVKKIRHITDKKMSIVNKPEESGGERLSDKIKDKVINIAKPVIDNKEKFNAGKQKIKTGFSKVGSFLDPENIINNLDKKIERTKKQSTVNSEPTIRELATQKKEEELKAKKAKAKLRAEKLTAKLKKKETIQIKKSTKKSKTKERRDSYKQKHREKKDQQKEEKQVKKEKRQQKFNQVKRRLQKVFKLLKRKSKKIIITAIAIVFILIILTVGISVLIYKFSSTNNLANLLLQKTNLPIVVVDYKPVSYSLYLEDQRLLNEYYQEIKQIEDNSILDISKVKEQDLILENIIKRRILDSLGSYYNVHITQNDLDYSFNETAEQTGGYEEFVDIIYNDYGLTKDLFIDKVTYYDVLYNKVKQAFISDDKVHKGTTLRMNKVVKLINKNKESFEDLARKYSEDIYVLKGGDIGYVNEVNMDEQLLTAASELEINNVSEVLKTEDRYYITKLYDKKINRRQETEYWLKEISIDTNYNFDAYLQDLRAEAKIWLLIQ